MIPRSFISLLIFARLARWNKGKEIEEIYFPGKKVEVELESFPWKKTFRARCE